MAKNIFIFINIVVYFLTIVSKNGFCCNSVSEELILRTTNILVKDTIKTIFADDFESGNLSGWEQTSDWEVSDVNPITGKFSLKQLANTTNNSSSIFHKVKSDFNNTDLEWTFQIRNGNWDPSSSNKFWVYLSSDTIQTDVVNGYALGVNISGTTDLLQLWRIKNGKADSLIVQTDLDWNASTTVKIDAKRTSRGFWTLTYQRAGELKSDEFSGKDPTCFTFHNIGVQFNFTTTRAGQLWVDDISVIESPSELFIRKSLLVNSHQIALTFNKPVNPNSIHSGNFELVDENNQDIVITNANLSGETNSKVIITFAEVRGIELNLMVSGIEDLSGKIMNPQNLSLSYSFTPEIGSILINEILFNPFPGGVDFVELVNVSDQTIPINRLKLATRNDTLGLKQIYPISSQKRYLKTGEFLVCTKDSAILSGQYFNHNPASFCVMKTLPSFSDDAGTVVLLNDSLEVLDEFSYSAKMHSPFLADENGVSLERISLNKPTSDRNNWASAAASIGFATPGLPNSQTISEPGIQDKITPDPKVFSPNGDGYNDELTIKYRFNKSGNIANVRIFDAGGQLVNFLVKNESLAQEGRWLWDGKNDSGQKQNIGVYIILVEIFDQNGNTKSFKKACSLTDRLD